MMGQFRRSLGESPMFLRTPLPFPLLAHQRPSSPTMLSFPSLLITLTSALAASASSFPSPSPLRLSPFSLSAPFFPDLCLAFVRRLFFLQSSCPTPHQLPTSSLSFVVNPTPSMALRSLKSVNLDARALSRSMTDALWPTSKAAFVSVRRAC